MTTKWRRAQRKEKIADSIEIASQRHYGASFFLITHSLCTLERSIQPLPTLDEVLFFLNFKRECFFALSIQHYCLSSEFASHSMQNLWKRSKYNLLYSPSTFNHSRARYNTTMKRTLLSFPSNYYFVFQFVFGCILSLIAIKFLWTDDAMSWCILIEYCTVCRRCARSRPEDKFRFNNTTEIQNSVFFSSSSVFIIGILNSNRLNGSLMGKHISLSGRRRSIVCAPLRQNKHTWSQCSYARERNAHIEWADTGDAHTAHRTQWAPALFALPASSSLHHLSMEYMCYALNTVNTMNNVQSNERLIAFV